MANQEHLDILKQGAKTWNQWRQEHSDIWPDLRGADLRGDNLSGDLTWFSYLDNSRVLIVDINLRGADFSEADLSRAILTNADLRGAILSYANLSGANLREADLSGAILTDADLSGAILTKADFSGADLRGADLSEAILTKADFRRANLSEAILIKANLNSANLIRANLNSANLIRATLSGANLRDANLSGASLSGASLSGADLRGTDLTNVNLSTLDLSKANLSGRDLSRRNLSKTNLNGAQLVRVNLTEANLMEANLQGAMLNEALLIKTNLQGVDLSGCSIHGISVWNTQLEGATQLNLVITSADEPLITVDSLEVAQFIYLLLNNIKIRQTIDAITSQVVLLLGRFPPERKEVLDALSEELRRQRYSPVVFNFEGTENKSFTPTVRTLANMARFVLLDLADGDNVIREIADEIIPRCVVPIRPLLLQGSHRQEDEPLRELGRTYRWVLAPYRYKDVPELQSSFQEQILQPIHERMIELKQKKPLKMFLGYAPEDTNLLKTLKTHLRLLERAGLIEMWDDQDIAPGEERRKEIERHLSEARIILLLISPAFLSSHDCYDLQMSMALERHSRAEASIIPILLHPCGWQRTPLKDLQPLPKDGKPISKHNKDDVFFEVSEEIGDMIKILG